MGYDAEIVRRARARLAAQRAESEQEQIRRTQEVYERFPRVKEIDQALRATVAQVVSAAFRTGEDPQRAVAQAQAENRKLQQERAWILEAAELGEAAVKGGSLTAFEKGCDNAVLKTAAGARRVPFGVEVALGYLIAKEAEWTAVRIVMAGRLAGLSADAIRERLRDAYV